MTKIGREMKQRIRALALATANHYLASQSRPLTVGSPAEAEDPTWDQETESLDQERNKFLKRTGDQGEILQLLRKSSVARKYAKRVLKPYDMVAVEGFGQWARQSVRVCKKPYGQRISA
jgi:hypothetical protein